MKKLALYSILVFSAFAFTGCFEILEEVSLAEDGTGTVKFTVNLSESKSTLANYLEMGEFQGVPVPTIDEMREELTKIQRTLQNVDGLSAVQVTSNFSDFVFQVSTKFSNVEALNTAINAVAAAMNRTPFETLELDNYDYTGKSFRRYFNYPISVIDFEEIPSMYKYALDTGTMTSIYHFDRTVRACTNDDAEISPTKRSVKLETTVGRMIRGESTIANSVILYPK